MDDFGLIANRIEAGFWFFVAICLLVKAFRSPVRERGILLVLCATFVVFGISDLVEAVTGAWWRPLWLLFMKGGCLFVLAVGFWRYFWAVKRRPD